MFLLLSSFLAGMLTSLAPCMLTLLPVIVGNSILPGQDMQVDRKKPYIISASLGVSVVLFTLILKASTALIGIDPKVWYVISGGIVMLLGVTMLFPNLWVQASVAVGLEQNSGKLLATAHKKSGLVGQILTGAALGPVFSGCSPVYALILATILPVDLAVGMVYIIAYGAGLSLALLLIALGGQKLVKKLGWSANPDGWFRRVLAIILILVGMSIIGGYDKKFQTWVIEKLPFDVTDIEERLISQSKPTSTTTTSSTTTDMSVLEINKAGSYQAPEIRGIQSWINSSPQTLAQLKGKVVLIDFWTYSCINCIRTQPYLNAWYDKYADKGLVILGMHAPEFAFERVPENVQKAVIEAGIKYPVGLDNDFATWRAYDNKYWPAKYLIDADGLVRYTHFGEGEYAETEALIQALLKERGVSVTDAITTENPTPAPLDHQTQETYLNYSRVERFANLEQMKADVFADYTLRDDMKADQWSFGGNWRVGSESSVSGKDARLQIDFSGKDAYLVMSGPPGSKIKALIDGKTLSNAYLAGADVKNDGSIVLDVARLYRIVHTESPIDNKRLLLIFPAGVTVNAFTFGN